MVVTGKDVSNTKEKRKILLGQYERNLKNKTLPIKIPML